MLQRRPAWRSRKSLSPCGTAVQFPRDAITEADEALAGSGAAKAEVAMTGGPLMRRPLEGASRARCYRHGAECTQRSPIYASTQPGTSTCPTTSYDSACPRLEARSAALWQTRRDNAFWRVSTCPRR